MGRGWQPGARSQRGASVARAAPTLPKLKTGWPVPAGATWRSDGAAAGRAGAGDVAGWPRAVLSDALVSVAVGRAPPMSRPRAGVLSPGLPAPPERGSLPARAAARPAAVVQNCWRSLRGARP